jgi:site-specific DNA-methyltransferase (adenine-specific)
VLRDITERVVIASNGRFDRAKSAQERKALGLPHVGSSSSDEFMAATLDVWDIPAESAKRVDHPAPFPVELPQRLIELYTYENDLVLDPFMGSGTTLVAAAKLGRRYVGFDTDRTYVALARRRVRGADDAVDEQQLRATKEGKAAQGIAEQRLRDAGFTITGQNVRLRGLGVTIGFVADDAAGVRWYFDTTGAFTATRGGLYRTDTVWRSLGRASVLATHGKRPLVLLTSHLPRRASEGDAALRAAGPSAFFDAIEMLADDGLDRLSAYAAGGHHDRPRPGFWTDKELARNRDR